MEMFLTRLSGIGWISYNPYILVFGAFCSMCDLIYIGLILNCRKKENAL